MTSNILKNNALIFKQKIVPYKFIIKTKNKDIIILNNMNNFKHLEIGGAHTCNLKINHMKSREFASKSIMGLIREDEIFGITENERNYLLGDRANYFYLVPEILNNTSTHMYIFNKKNVHGQMVNADYMLFRLIIEEN